MTATPNDAATAIHTAETRRSLVILAQREEDRKFMARLLFGPTMEPKHKDMTTICGCGHIQRGGISVARHDLPGQDGVRADDRERCNIRHI